MLGSRPALEGTYVAQIADRLGARHACTGLAASLAGCGVGAGLTGNDFGGIIPWSPENQAVARDWAAQHCAYYGKVAHLQPIYGATGNTSASPAISRAAAMLRLRRLAPRDAG